ncbi:DMT family transporter [Rhodoplanes sp. TEM]|uniref:DMT family transporter n=1 Tax=Rhodoplanes tepidamans TaxID=200616 RepID=A0ABT5JGI6_RHOTP|nr:MULTISPECIES: DMT family transporter [Rhodoplanes]MDC7788820.1 DMT family transporter [Rhodoplanes tepidamans]MDC7987684.1 DMT family transporter [Rhodoplanes sp. TEM]MDQ0359035.1 drug/metabolite transporter (DMT)-like permease [Rhodoplanes tepidamans]
MTAPPDPPSPPPPTEAGDPGGTALPVPAGPDPAAHAQRMRLLGILLMCGAVACFACLDATAKFLGRHVDVIQVVWARYASAFVLALLVFNPLTRPGLLRTRRPGLQIGRSTLLLATTVLNFAALKYLQLDQALAILFSTPLMVAALAGPMLGERIGPRRWAAIVVGLVGVVIVLQPGVGAVHPAALLSMLSAVCAAFYAIATRVLSRFDTDETTLFYSNLVGVLLLTPVMPFVWTTPTDPLLIALMIGFGAFGSLGHFLLIVAHRHTPASILSPFSYSQILWTTILGFVVFGDIPNRWTIAGVTIVIASGLYLLHRERVRRRG